MKICYFDAFSGISGDMTVGALVDAGAIAKDVVRALESLDTGAAFRFEKVKRGGIAASKFHVDAPESSQHRHLKQILDIIERAELAPRAKQNAAMVFERLGAAEARVHDVPIDRVHFHEVGAVDSICDIVGACAGLDQLDIDAIHCSPVNLGGGTVKTEHGLLPVPAPATAELLKGKPVYSRGPSVELTTPTGAALAATLAAECGALPPMRLCATGYGAGSKDFPDHANVLRVILGETTAATESTTVAVIEANIDDATPQILGYAMERLFDAGALDVTLESVLMKKNRPGTLLRIIATPEARESLAQILFEETTTLGLRIYPAERRVKARRIVEVETAHGRVRIKISDDGSFAPEYDDCRKLARETGVPLKQVLAQASLAYLKNSR